MVATRLSSPGKGTDAASVLTLPSKPKHKHSKIPHSTSFPPPIEESESPPPLPKRNKNFNENNAHQSQLDSKYVFTDESRGLSNRNSKIPKNINAAFLDNEINLNIRQNINKNNTDNHGKKNTSRYTPHSLFGSKNNACDLTVTNLLSPNKNNSNIDESKRVKINIERKKSNSKPTRGVTMDNILYTCDNPPPLPPRLSLPLAESSDPDAVNSINKQMSYPLVATCATLVNNYVSNTSFSILHMLLRKVC